VLVDFWATWCGPCIQEIPNIRKNYDAYHDRGFDVIGISVDQDREALVSFLDQHKEPWLVLCDQDLADSQTGEMMGDRYGIFSIPTMALIGADGKVVAMNPRGPQLGQELEKLLGPVEEKKEEVPAPEGKPAANTEKTEEPAPGEGKSGDAESGKKQ
jgi:thiol-disulfide isomerase/thioredoxin